MKRKTSKAPLAEAQTIGETSASPQALFTPERLAELIAFHPESVRRLIRDGRIRAIKFGAGWRIPGDEVGRITTGGL